MIIVGRHINGIVLNPLEYLLDSEDGEAMEFETEDAAKVYLREQGYDDEELEWFVFESVDDDDDDSPEEPEDECSDERASLDPLTKEQFINARASISRIEDLFTSAEKLFDGIPIEIQTAILNYHREPATLQHCIRWGLQAAKDIREDWHNVVSKIPCEKGDD